MNSTYYEQLPRNYFNNLYERILDYLLKQQNTYVAVMHGCGGKTFLNLFLHYYKTEKHQPVAIYYDPLIEKQELFKFSQNALQTHKRCLIVIRQFENIPNKKILLEKLNHLRYPFPERITFLVITDHTAVTSPQDYVSLSGVFFSHQEYLAPLNLNQTTEMITINSNYYGWQTPSSLNEKIYAISGGIPRLIKYIAKDISEKGNIINNLDLFLMNPAINYQVDYCTQLLLQFDKKILHTLGLLENNRISSTLLQHYFETYQSTFVKVTFPQLTSLERAILSYLFEKKGEIVSIDHIGDLLELQGQEFSQWAIYKQISRIKPKIAKLFTIENIKGQGYILNQA